MRTYKEILSRINQIAPFDRFGFETSYLLEFLPYNALPEKMQEHADPCSWVAMDRTEEHIRTRMIDYMSYAWEKANDERGISAYRSMCHYNVWLWMLGEDWGDLTEGYTDYGKPTLRRLCDFLSLDAAQFHG